MADPPSVPPAKRRPPRSRISPEAMAAARGGALEGLAWLGRAPESRASWSYRLLRLIGPFRTGWAIIALRTDAPVVPFAIAGTEELYLGHRMASRVLEPTTARALAGLAPGAALPEPGSRAEFEVARRMSEALAALLDP